MRLATITIVGAMAGGVLGPVSPIGAQPADSKARAEHVFEQGRELAKNEKWAEACPKFEASLRYDDALGTRLNLANCYEHSGRLASAWGLYRDAADRARRAGDAKRRDYALKQAAALVPRLARLTITSPSAAPRGLAISRDGTTIDPAELGSAMYVDPGPHEITATAPGFEPFKTSVTIAEAGSESVAIPELAPSKPAVAPRPRAPLVTVTPHAPLALPPKPVERPGGSPTRRYLAIGTATTGVALSGLGLALGARARSTYGQARSVCEGLICESEADLARGRELISQARKEAALSTIFVATGAAAVGTGVVLWLTAPKRARPERARVTPVITGRDVGLSVTGRF